MGLFGKKEEEIRSGPDLLSRENSEKDIETSGGTQQDGPPTPWFDKAVEQRVARKIDMNSMPPVMVLCGHASFGVKLR